MSPFHILCLNETRIQNIHTNQSISNALSKTINVLSCYNGHQTMILFDSIMSLKENKLFNTFFNKNPEKAFYIIVIYKLSQMQTNYFISIFKLTLK